ncbi:MAG: Gfo/Idh/MocA family oxidoreductase [Candidatus Hydrogenedentes bacterium]|nr:Gfo/Idh/MocA family oxidoreductase [Candidatus Hydrogenedentota bacterium]
MSLRVNIIGLGIMGKNVARALLRNRAVTVTAAADTDDGTRSAAQMEFRLPSVYADYRVMLDTERPDAVFIATPDWAHRDPVMDALERCIHVHVEKPLTTTEHEAAEIARKVVDTGLKLQVSYNHRWLAPYYAAFEQIRDGAIGDCIAAYARKNNPITVPTRMLAGWAKDSSPMWFQSAHDIDLVNWYFNDLPVQASCQGVKRVLKERHGWDTWDALHGRVRYAGGAIATYEAGWIYPEKHPAMPDSFVSITGTDGHLTIDRKAEAMELSTEDGLAWPRSFLNKKVFDAWVGAFPSCINSFIDAVLDDFTPHVNVLDGWKTTAVLDALHRSAAQDGAPIAIAPPPISPEVLIPKRSHP